MDIDAPAGQTEAIRRSTHHDEVPDGLDRMGTMDTVARRLTADTTLPAAQVARIAAGVGAELDALHAAGRLAGALNPARLLITPEGTVRLGPAPAGDADVAYTAPEVLEGDEPTAAADAYALAATCYALLAGAPPYGHGQPAVLRALTESPPELARPGLPAEVGDVLRRGLARRPADRLAPGAFGAVLATALGTVPATALGTAGTAGTLGTAGTAGTAGTLGAGGGDPARLATLPPTQPAPTGTPLGSGYLLDEAIGSGATGRVWRAHRRSDGAAVAVKVLREEFSRDPDMVARFLRERTLLRSLTHPNLVRVHDLVVEGDTLAIVMELVAGQDLRRARAGRPFGPDAALDLLAQVAEALAAVHAAGLVHRDIKPENILLTWPGGRPWAQLTDFGLARTTDSPALTRASQLVGTPAYLAPELVAGRPPGPAVDVYALGVTAYELLAGHRPFPEANTAALLRAHLDTVPDRPAGIAPDAWPLLAACLDKDPARRPDALELAAGFTALRGRTPAPAPSVAATPMPSLGAPPPAAGSVTAPASAPLPVLPSGPVPGPGPAASTGTGAAQALPTAGATRPADAAPEQAPVRRGRRGLVVAAIVACAVLGTGAGLWFGRPTGRENGTPPTPSPTVAQPRSTLFPIAATASSPRSGVVTLTFGDESEQAGFYSYVVFRDGNEIAQPHPGEAPPYTITGLDAGTQHCYQVYALVVTRESPSTKVKPTCLTADGGHR